MKRFSGFLLGIFLGAAGMFVVGVPSTPGSEPDADLIIASLADVDTTGLLDGIMT